MGILDELTETTPVDLNDYIETSPLAPLGIPEAAVRNRAASTALLTSTPDKMVEQYQAMLFEAENGRTNTMDTIKKEADVASHPLDMKAIIGILGDTSLDEVSKMEAIKSINSGFMKDTSTTIATQALSAPSPSSIGAEQEDVRVVGMANQLRDTFEYRKALQAMRNKHGASLNSETSVALLDFIETVLPFSTNKRAYSQLTKLKEELGVSGNKAIDTVLAGSTTAAIREVIEGMPPSERIKILEPIKKLISTNSGIMFRDDNDFNEWTTMEQIFGEGGYSSFDEGLDNIVGVLDIIGLGSTPKALVKRVGKLFTRTPSAVEDNVRLASITGDNVPVAPANILAEVNPDKARDAYSLVVKSTDEEMAKALYGTTRDEAVFNQVAPKIITVDGSVPAQVVNIDRKVIAADVKTLNTYYRDGAIDITPGEKAQAAKTVFDNLNATHLTINDAMTQVGVDGRQVVYKAVYGTSEGGFKNADDAVNQAKFALRDYGVQEADIQILKKVDLDYVPVSLDEVKGVDGDYVVQVIGRHDINPSDIPSMESFNVKWNWLSRIPVTFKGVFGKKSGSLNRWLFDAGSMFRTELSGGAIVATDRAVALDKALLHQFDDFAKRYKSLPSNRQEALFEHIKEANFNKLELSDGDLLARGFQREEIETLKDWRKAWDTHFWFENADLVRTLQLQGFKLFENNDIKFVVKEIGPSVKVTRAYDPALDKVVEVAQKESKELYEKGGSYASLRRPQEIDGEVVEHMIVRNTPNEYARAVTNNDQILNYNKGYYQIKYTAPKFLEKIVRSESGQELYRKAVAYGASTEDLARVRERLARAEGVSPEEFGSIRSDIRELATDSDQYWDLQSASGRIAQRHRGKLLEDSTGPINASQGQYILDPVQSAVRASRSLSGRMAARPFLETAKNRAARQFKHLFPKNKYGGVDWPDDASMLINPGNATVKEMGEARATVEYLNYLENGYTNALDEGYKGIMSAMANTMASVGSPKGERFLNFLGTAKPMQAGKNIVHQAYIATNPHRQWLIQTYGGVRLLAYNPKYILSLKEHVDIINYMITSGADKLGLAAPTSKKAREIADFIESSGVLAGVDRHNLVRGALGSMVENSNMAVKAAGKIASIPQRIGFNPAEQFNMLNHMLAVRDKYVRTGKNVMDKTVMDQIVAEARAISGNMNFAGDMPYNQNWASLFFQFFQVPHKALLQYTNRTIPGADRMKLAAMDMLMFGAPAGLWLNSLIGEEMLPKQSEYRDILIDGLTYSLVNSGLSTLAGEDVDIDTSSLSPFETEGWAKMANVLMTGGFGDLALNSPSANIFLKENSRIKDAIVRISRYTGFYDAYEGTTPEDLNSVVDGVLSISSGWTNWQKAKFIMETGKIVDKKGNVMMEDASFMYGLAKAFGFGSKEEALFYAASKEVRTGTKEHFEQVNQWYDGYIRLLSRKENLVNTDDEFVTKVLGLAKRIYVTPEGTDYKALEIISNNLKRDIVSDDFKIIKGALKYARIKGARESLHETERFMTLDSERQKYMQLIEDINRKYDEKEQ